jgi:hypothetical protein
MVVAHVAEGIPVRWNTRWLPDTYSLKTPSFCTIVFSATTSSENTQASTVNAAWPPMLYDIALDAVAGDAS